MQPARFMKQNAQHAGLSVKSTAAATEDGKNYKLSKKRLGQNPDLNRKTSGDYLLVKSTGFLYFSLIMQEQLLHLAALVRL